VICKYKPPLALCGPRVLLPQGAALIVAVVLQELFFGDILPVYIESIFLVLLRLIRRHRTYRRKGHPLLMNSKI